MSHVFHQLAAWQFLTANPGAQSSQVARKLKISTRLASMLLNRMRADGTADPIAIKPYRWFAAGQAPIDPYSKLAKQRRRGAAKGQAIPLPAIELERVWPDSRREWLTAYVNRSTGNNSQKLYGD
jgi:hypothetical protein